MLRVVRLVLGLVMFTVLSVIISACGDSNKAQTPVPTVAVSNWPQLPLPANAQEVTTPTYFISQYRNFIKGSPLTSSADMKRVGVAAYVTPTSTSATYTDIDNQTLALKYSGDNSGFDVSSLGQGYAFGVNVGQRGFQIDVLGFTVQQAKNYNAPLPPNNGTLIVYVIYQPA